MFKIFNIDFLIKTHSTVVDIIHASVQYKKKLDGHRNGVKNIGSDLGLPNIIIQTHDILKYLPHSLILNGINRYNKNLTNKFPLLRDLVRFQKKIHRIVNPHHSEFFLWNIPYVTKTKKGIYQPQIFAQEGAVDIIQSIREDYPNSAQPKTLKNFLQSPEFEDCKKGYNGLSPTSKHLYNEVFCKYYILNNNITNTHKKI